KQVFPLAVFSEKTNTYIGQPTIIGANGVIDILEPKLTTDEVANFNASAEVIKTAFQLIE
ncbi:L-lactate dehydrogenase, partial [Listeria monocytogenes]|nr:L-lactate dehydrogenase [Listeria monocytogenes]